MSAASLSAWMAPSRPGSPCNGRSSWPMLSPRPSTASGSGRSPPSRRPSGRTTGTRNRRLPRTSTRPSSESTAAPPTEWSDDWDPEKEATPALHTPITEVLGSPPAVPLRETSRQGNAAGELVQASQGAHLLVVGSRGPSGFARHLLGSVSKAIAEHAHCPVLIIHGDTAPPPRA